MEPHMDRGQKVRTVTFAWHTVGKMVCWTYIQIDNELFGVTNNSESAFVCRSAMDVSLPRGRGVSIREEVRSRRLRTSRGVVPTLVQSRVIGDARRTSRATLAVRRAVNTARSRSQ